MIDMRKPLDPGVKVGEYVIDGCLSSGGSCIVYNAHCEDKTGTTFVILKECYPDKQEECPFKLRRVGTELQWDDKDEQKKDIDSFQKSCELINKYLFAKGTANNTVAQVKYIELNNTVYSAVLNDMDGEVFSNYECKTISEILLIIRNLVDLIGKYHKDGKKLFIDLKPSNFMVSTDTSDQKIIRFFDLDSIVDCDEEGRLVYNKGIRYSDGYCAPEITQYNDSNLDEKKFYAKRIGTWSDFYSIGMILFECVTGWSYDQFDAYQRKYPSFNCLNDDVFKSERGRDLNPRVKSLVRGILKDCLLQEPHERKEKIPNAESLRKRLDEALNVCEEPYLVSNIPGGDLCFGREEELVKLNEIFAKHGQTVILEGPGGIGKTTLALEYYARAKKEGTYSTGVYLDFKNGVLAGIDEKGLKGLLTDVVIMNYPSGKSDEEIEKELETKKELLNQEGVFILLDNFDIPTESVGNYGVSFTKVLEDINKICEADVIITSRAVLFEGKQNRDIVTVSGLDKNEVMTFFGNDNYPLSEKEKEDLSQLYREVSGNTLALKLLGNLYTKQRNGWTIADLCEKFHRASGLGEQTIRMSDIDKRMTPDKVLSSVWDIYGLSEEEQKVLCLMYLFRRTMLSDKIIEIFFPKTEERAVINNTLDTLVDYGWVIREGTKHLGYELHSLVQYLVGKELSYMQTEQYFPDLKRWEYLMYFRFSRRHEFEKGDYVKTLILPNIEPPACLGYYYDTFWGLLRAQKDGFIGEVVVEEGNPYCYSKGPAIYAVNERNGEKALLFLDINASLPTDEDISILEPFSCSYNQTEKMVIPSSVKRINGEAFNFSCNKEIVVPSSVEYVGEEAFSSEYEHGNTRVLFQGFNPQEITSMFWGDRIEASFDNGILQWDGIFLYNQDRTVIYGGSGVVNNGELIVPDGVHTIKSWRPLNYDCRIKRKIILPGSVVFFPEGMLGFFSEVMFSGQSSRYLCFDNYIVDIQRRMIIWGKGKIPENPLVDTIGPHSFRLEEHEDLVLSPNIRTIREEAFVNVDCWPGNLYLHNQVSKIGRYSLFPFFRIYYEGTKRQFLNLINNEIDFFPIRCIVCSDGILNRDDIPRKALVSYAYGDGWRA